MAVDIHLRDAVARKRRLAEMRAALPKDAFSDIERHHRLDLTYTSNAIEGNTLTAGETRLVIEENAVIAGKSLKEHFEAVDHQRALELVYDLADAPDGLASGITGTTIRAIQELVVRNSDPDAAGHYASKAMGDFTYWLNRPSNQTPVERAFEAHYRLVNINPFDDGNGRTSRLLMNLILLRHGYPAIAVRPEDRPAYITALEHGDFDGFVGLLLHRIDDALDLYLEAGRQALELNRRAHGAPSAR